MLSFWSSDYASRNTSEPGKASLRNTAGGQPSEDGET